MPRVKTGVVRRRRHKKVLKAARGFFWKKKTLQKKLKEQLERSLVYAFLEIEDRKKET